MPKSGLKSHDTERDQAILDLEEVSDLLSEVGTSLADQDYSTAQTQWNEALGKLKELSINMADLFKDE